MADTNEALAAMMAKQKKFDNITGGIGGALTGAISAVNSWKQASQIADTTNFENNLYNQLGAVNTASSFDELTAGSNSRGINRKLTYKEIFNGGSYDLGGLINSGMQLFGTIGGLFSRGSKAASKMHQLDSLVDQTNAYNVSSDINRANTLKNLQAQQAIGATLAEGGGLDMYNNGVTEINNGGTHEENPLGGVPYGMDANGKPNLVEEGEVVYKDFVFSNRVEVPKEIQKKYNIKGKTFAEAFKNIQKESKERPNDKISQQSLDKYAQTLASLQEKVKATNAQQQSLMSPGLNKQSKTMQPNVYGLGTDILGVAPNLLANLSDLVGATNTPIRLPNVPRTQPITYTPVGQRLEYTPLDINYLANKQLALANAQKSALRGVSPSSNAALLAANNNIINNSGDLFKKGIEANLAQKQSVLDFNRTTDKTNSTLGMNTSYYNSARQAADNKVDLDRYKYNAESFTGAQNAVMKNLVYTGEAFQSMMHDKVGKAALISNILNRDSKASSDLLRLLGFSDKTISYLGENGYLTDVKPSSNALGGSVKRAKVRNTNNIIL